MKYAPAAIAICDTQMRKNRNVLETVFDEPKANL